MAHSRYLAVIAGACLATVAAPAIAQDPPMVSIDHISLNPTNFYVSIIVSNTHSGVYFALEAYEGEPVGSTGGVQRTIVSDWVEGTGSSFILYDKSAPLSQFGRTYNVALALEIGGFYILGANEVYAPYPFFTSPDISSIVVTPTNTGQVLAITYGEGLYTNTVYVSNDDATGFIRVKGTNNIPTNAVIERSTDPITWTTTKSRTSGSSVPATRCRVR